MFYRLCHVHETSPGTHTFFPTYTCPVYCWRSVQLLDFSLYCNLIHASQPVRTTFTGQWFASGFLQTPPHDDALAIGCTLPTAGRVRDFHPLERVPAGHTTKNERQIFLTFILKSNKYKFLKNNFLRLRFQRVHQPTQRMGSRAFSSSVTPAASIMRGSMASIRFNF